MSDISVKNKDNTLIQSLKSKYPFIDEFVDKITDLKLNENCFDKNNLSVWISFLFVYINSCLYLKSKNLDINKENIKNVMQEEFDKTHYMNYIEILSKLEIVNTTNASTKELNIMNSFLE